MLVIVQFILTRYYAKLLIKNIMALHCPKTIQGVYQHTQQDEFYKTFEGGC